MTNKTITVNDQMQSQKAYRIKILPALKQSFALIFEKKKEIFILGWLPFALYTIFGILDGHFPSVLNYIVEPIASMHKSISYGILYDFSYYLVDLILSTAFLIALYRLFILDEKNQYYTWNYKRGIYEQKTVLSVPWYYRLGKKELQLIVIYLLLGIIFDALRQLNMSTLIYSVKSAGRFEIDTFDRYIYYSKYYSIWLIEGLFFASLIFISPAIAITKDFKFSSIGALFQKVRGNIIRIFIIGQLIYLPMFLAGKLNEVILYFSFPLQSTTQQIISDVYLIFSNLVFYICMAVDCAFISLIYKALNEEQ